MGRPFFSILIPVYNVERYIEKCLNSIINQTFEDFEVILMDDGSPDLSVEICQSFLNKDKRFRLFHQGNKGLLLTRRELFKLANGDFVISLDSDDFFETDTLKILHDTILKYKCDMVLFRHNLTNDQGTKIGESKILFPENRIFDENNKNEILERFFTSSSINSMCFKVVKREIIDINEDYSIYKDVKGEDALQSVAMFRNAKIIVSINNCLSNYRSAQNNRSNNFKSKYLYDLFIVREKLYEYLIEQQYDDNKTDGFFNYFLATLRIYLSFLITKVQKNEFDEILNHIGNEKLFKLTAERAERFNFLNRVFLYMIKNERRFLLKGYIKSYMYIRLLMNKTKSKYPKIKIT